MRVCLSAGCGCGKRRPARPAPHRGYRIGVRHVGCGRCGCARRLGVVGGRGVAARPRSTVVTGSSPACRQKGRCRLALTPTLSHGERGKGVACRLGVVVVSGAPLVPRSTVVTGSSPASRQKGRCRLALTPTLSHGERGKGVACRLGVVGGRGVAARPAPPWLPDRVRQDEEGGGTHGEARAGHPLRVPDATSTHPSRS